MATYEPLPLHTYLVPSGQWGWIGGPNHKVSDAGPPVMHSMDYVHARYARSRPAEPSNSIGCAGICLQRTRLAEKPRSGASGSPRIWSSYLE